MNGPDLDGFLLLEDKSGGGFTLSDESPTSESVDLDGWTIQVKQDSRYVIAQVAKQADSFEDLRQQVLIYVQRGLDYMAVRGRANLRTEDTADRHVIWWPEREGLCARICTTVRFESRSGPELVTLTVNDGSAQPAPELPAVWHQSMRLWRQSQLSVEGFETLRSLWLAIENLLDDLVPYDNEGEGRWIRKAFREVNSRLDLTNYLPATRRDPVDEAYEYFYNSLRNFLFHAKGSKGTHLPHEPGYSLAERHERLTRLYLDLLRNSHSVARGGGTFYGFELAMRKFDSGCTVFATNDASSSGAGAYYAGDPDATLASVRADAMMVSNSPWPNRATWMGSIPGSEICNLNPNPIFHVGLAHEGELLARSDIDGYLTVGSLARLEIQYRLRLDNVDLSKVVLDG